MNTVQSKYPQHIVVNTYSQSTYSAQNKDNNFIVNLATQYDNIKTLQLNQFTMLNFFSNYSEQYQDFSYSVNGVAYQLTISHLYHTVSQFFQYFNSVQANTVLSYTINPLTNFLIITSTQPFSPIGVGWQMLGFGNYIAGVENQQPQLNQPNQLIWYPSYPYDFSASPVIYIVFNNIMNGSNQGDGSVSFCIPNESSYGSLLVYNNPHQYGNQMVTFQAPISITTLNISILDVYKRLIHTTSLIGDDNTEQSICMSLTAYPQ